MHTETIFGKECIKFWNDGDLKFANTISTNRGYISIGCEGNERGAVKFNSKSFFYLLTLSAAIKLKEDGNYKIDENEDANITHLVKEGERLSFYRKHLWLFDIENRSHCNEFVGALLKVIN